MITFSIDINEALNKLPQSIDKKKLDSAVVRALNKASRNLRSDAIKTLRDDLGFPTKGTSPRNFKQKNASISDLEVVLKVNGAPIPLIDFKGVSINSKFITTKYTDKYITPSEGFKYFRVTDWGKVQSEYNARFASGKASVTKSDGSPLDFGRKKNANRTTIQQVSDQFQTPKSSASALFDANIKRRREMDEAFGISAATGITMSKFNVKFIEIENKLQADFEDELVNLLDK